jgi:hypothetical protein
MKKVNLLLAASVAFGLFACQKSNDIAIEKPIETPIVQKASIAGKIKCSETTGFSGVKIEVSSDALPPQTVFTDAKGFYEIKDLPVGANYTLKTSFDDADPLNGITTLDFTLLSKHILGTQPLSSTQSFVASDLNLSNSVDNKDLELMRQLILGIYDNKKLVTWRFIGSDYEAPTAANPQGKGAVNTMVLNNLQTDQKNVDFSPVKVADLNGNASCK